MLLFKIIDIQICGILYLIYLKPLYLCFFCEVIKNKIILKYYSIIKFQFLISLKEGNILRFTILEYSLFLVIIFLITLLIIKYFSLKKLKAEQKELKRKSNILRQYNKATKSSNIISNSDLKGNITYVNDTFCEVSQYKREEIIGRPHNILRGEEDPEVFKNLWTTIKSGNIWRGNLKNKKKDGTYYYINTTISPIFDEDGEIFEYVAIRHEITDLVLKTERAT